MKENKEISQRGQDPLEALDEMAKDLDIAQALETKQSNTPVAVSEKASEKTSQYQTEKGTSPSHQSQSPEPTQTSEDSSAQKPVSQQAPTPIRKVQPTLQTNSDNDLSSPELEESPKSNKKNRMRNFLAVGIGAAVVVVGAVGALAIGPDIGMLILLIGAASVVTAGAYLVAEKRKQKELAKKQAAAQPNKARSQEQQLKRTQGQAIQTKQETAAPPSYEEAIAAKQKAAAERARMAASDPKKEGQEPLTKREVLELQAMTLGLVKDIRNAKGKVSVELSEDKTQVIITDGKQTKATIPVSDEKMALDIFDKAMGYSKMNPEQLKTATEHIQAQRAAPDLDANYVAPTEGFKYTPSDKKATAKQKVLQAFKRSNKDTFVSDAVPSRGGGPKNYNSR